MGRGGRIMQASRATYRPLIRQLVQTRQAKLSLCIAPRERVLPSNAAALLQSLLRSSIARLDCVYYIANLLGSDVQTDLPCLCLFAKCASSDDALPHNSLSPQSLEKTPTDIDYFKLENKFYVRFVLVIFL